MLPNKFKILKNRLENKLNKENIAIPDKNKLLAIDYHRYFNNMHTKQKDLPFYKSGETDFLKKPRKVDIVNFQNDVQKVKFSRSLK